MPQLSIEIVYHDEDLTEVLAIATNGRYSGCTAVYSNPEELIDFGHQIKGFPKNVSQGEEAEFGFTKKVQKELQEFIKNHPESKNIVPYSTAYMHLKFYCVDSIGHPAVHVILQEDTWSRREEAIGKASFEIRFEPAQIDRFADELIELGKSKTGKAILVGILDDKDNFA